MLVHQSEKSKPERFDCREHRHYQTQTTSEFNEKAELRKIIKLFDAWICVRVAALNWKRGNKKRACVSLEIFWELAISIRIDANSSETTRNLMSSLIGCFNDIVYGIVTAHTQASYHDLFINVNKCFSLIFGKYSVYTGNFSADANKFLLKYFLLNVQTVIFEKIPTKLNSLDEKYNFSIEQVTTRWEEQFNYWPFSVGFVIYHFIFDICPVLYISTYIEVAVVVEKERGDIK